MVTCNRIVKPTGSILTPADSGGWPYPWIDTESHTESTSSAEENYCSQALVQ